MNTNSDSTSASAGPKPAWRGVRLIRWIFHPRRLRVYLFACLCVITLGVLFTLMENWRGYRAWETVRSAYEAAGDPLSLEELVPPPVSDDQNFAVTPLLAPLFDFHPGTQEWRDTNGVERVMQLTRRWHKLAEQDTNHWMLGQTRDLATWAVRFDPNAQLRDMSGRAGAVLDALLEYEPVLEELHHASDRPHARFNIQYDAEDPATALLPHLSVLRSLVRILALRASANLALDQPEDAWRDVRLGFHLIDTIHDEPFVVSQLVRCKMLDEVLQPVWEGWVDRKWPAQILLELQSTLDRTDFWSDWIHALRGERALGNARINRIRRDPTLLPHALFLHESGDENSWWANLVLRGIPRGWFRQEQVQFNLLFDRAIFEPLGDSADSVDPDAVRAAVAEVEIALSPGQYLEIFRRHRVIASVLLVRGDVFGTIELFPSGGHYIAAYSHVSANLVRTACALERHRLARGQFPETLDALTPAFMSKVPRDLIRGQDLKYRRLDDGSFQLYSLGWDGIDQGGHPISAPSVSPEGASGDWIWPSLID
jgi:hypothetical protein